MEDLGLDGEEKMLGPTDQLLYMAPESKSELYYYLKQFIIRGDGESERFGSAEQSVDSGTRERVRIKFNRIIIILSFRNYYNIII